MKFGKNIAIVFLAIYTIVLLHDIIPHHHHQHSLVLGLSINECSNEETHNHYNHHTHIVDNEDVECSCHVHKHPYKHNEEEHENCKITKLQISKFFVFSISPKLVFNQQILLAKIDLRSIINAEVPSIFDIYRRGPPNSYLI